MTDFVDDPEVDEVAAFEALGRRAGAELRTPPPESAIDDLERAVRGRAMARVATGTVAILALLVVGWVALRDRLDQHGEPVDRTPVPTVPIVPLPIGEPGTWRALSAPVDPPNIIFSATWTGAEVVVLGFRGVSTQTATAHAYDVMLNTWQTLSPPPAALSDPTHTAWTGSEVLTADSTGSVFSFDPKANEWRSRATPPAVIGGPEGGGLVAVSPNGVLVHAQDEWLWYEESADTWTTVASPDSRFDGALTAPNGVVPASLDVLAPDMFVLASADGGAIRFATFDASTKRWSSTREATSPPVTRDDPGCQVVGGRLVCVAEGYSRLDGVVIDMQNGAEKPFTLGSHSNSLSTAGTPWFGHAWRLLLARTAEWEPLPPLRGVEGFSRAIWDGKELIMVGGQSESGSPASEFAAAYTPVVQP